MTGASPPPRVVVPSCPFCGAGDGFRQCVRVAVGWAVQCCACYALGPAERTPAEARKAWSTRIVRRRQGGAP